MRLPRNPLRAVVLALLGAAALTALGIAACRRARGEFSAEWTAGELKIAVDGRGRVAGLWDRRTGVDYRVPSADSPLLAVRVAGTLRSPLAFRFDRKTSRATLEYEGGARAVVRVEAKPTHITFELVSAEPAGRVELVVWGPYGTFLRESVGETVGIASGEGFTLGLQALNPKTLGGYPWDENDCMPQPDGALYRVEAAKPETFGSTLQAYCRDRGRARVVANWDYPRYVAPRYADGGVAGSKIALFGCPTAKALETIGRIEVAEGLPHPMIDGQWGKTSVTAAAAYVIMDFGEADIDRAIDIVEAAGLRYLYHPGPFRTWGHFDLDEARFPGGTAGLKACVDKAEARGIHVGAHTLTNFITTNDAYVTPVPDPRLARAGASALAASVDERQTEIPLRSAEFFDPAVKDTLRAAAIGSEIVVYRSISETAPPRLTGCERGAFGTKPSPHRKGETAAKLADHAYKVFLADAALGREMAERLARLFNETGLRQISFDGMEGNRATGMGNYGEILFAKTWFDALSPSVRSHYIADASRTSHYFWHIYSRMNWGEPWGAGFREGQTEYRLKNQPYFRRNLMPAMLGWFEMRPGTTLEDVEWLLARSAGYDAGYGFITSPAIVEQDGAAPEMLAAIGRWEKARLAGAFTDDQKARMQDIRNEFRLADAGDGAWTLTRVYPYRFRHESPTAAATPGRAAASKPADAPVSTFTFPHPAGAGPTMGFVMTAEGAEASEVVLWLDGNAPLILPAKIPAGWSARFDGGAAVRIVDENQKVRGQARIDPGLLDLAPGEHTLAFQCRFAGAAKDVRPAVKIEVRVTGRVERVTPENP